MAAILLFACSNSLAAPADELRALLEQGRSADAYALGRSHAEELGKPDFDFYYGIAAGLSDQDMADLAAYYGVPAK